MGKFKAILLLIFILAIATPLSILAIQQYQATKAIVDARQQEELKEKLAEQEKAELEKRGQQKSPPQAGEERPQEGHQGR